MNGQDGIARDQDAVTGPEEGDVARRMARRGNALPIWKAWTPAPGSNARATSLKLDSESIDSRRRRGITRINGRMTQMSSGLPYCSKVEKSPATSGSSSGCT